jgi:carboxylesterase type B
VPFLIGANHDEGTAFGPRGINTTAEYVDYLGEYVTDNTSLAILSALYPDIPEIGIPGTFQGRPGADLGLMYKRTSAVAGDYSMHAPRRLTNQAWAAHNVTSYSYVFNVLVNGQPNTIGATHFQEVVFVFDNTNGLGYPQNGNPNPLGDEPQSYLELARLMTRMWAGFISGGDPNLSGGMCGFFCGSLLVGKDDADS